MIETYLYPGRRARLAGIVTNAECSIKSRLLQILNRISIFFTTVKTACDQCKYSLRDENHNFGDSKFGLLVLGLDVENRLKADETLSKLNKR